jgi:hypothetical protein
VAQVRTWVVVALVVLLVGAAPAGLALAQQQPGQRSGQQPQVPAMGIPAGGADPSSVITAFELARNRGDIDGALAYFAADASIRQRTSVMSGHVEIRRYLELLISRGRYPSVTNRRVDGTRVLWIERGMGQNASLAETSVEAVVVEGKIKLLAFQGAPAGQRNAAALDTRGQLPAMVGLGSVLLLLLGTLVMTSTRFGRTASAPSTLQGRLMHDLRGWRTARLKA